MDGFHLTLPSDGSMETFPDNTLAHCKTRLPQPLDFTEGEWEVGLTKMLYPTFLENISKDEAFLDLLIPFEPQTQKDIEGSNAFLISKLIMEEIGKVSAQVVQGQPVDPVESKKRSQILPNQSFLTRTNRTDYCSSSSHSRSVERFILE